MASLSDDAPAPIEPSEESKKLHADLVDEIHKRQVSGSENFDKSVLTYSSAGLALSVGFLKDFVPIASATAAWALYVSWGLFTFATCATMVSFLLSGHALEHQKRIAYAYYLEGDEKAYDRRNGWNGLTVALNNLSAVSFMIALVLTVLFISTNLAQGSAMKPTGFRTNDGLPIPSMQASSPQLVEKGLPVPSMQKVPGHVSNPVTTPLPTLPVVPPASSPSK